MPLLTGPTEQIVSHNKRIAPSELCLIASNLGESHLVRCVVQIPASEFVEVWFNSHAALL
jgi:hypothetical protein